jgi:ubiquinone/menaquinone biosynthesis C-methylase UbiE
MATERDTVSNYEKWFLSPAGMYTDDKEKELLINAMRFKRGERVLEIGCGTGRNLEYLTGVGLNATGVEPVDEFVRRARLRSTIKQDQIIKAPYEKIPLANGSFENVIFMSTFAFATDKNAAMREAYRIASKKIGIGFLNSNSLTNIFKAKERRAVYKDAAPLSGKEMIKIAREALKSREKEYTLKIKYTLYMPVKVGYLVSFVDDILEQTNIPFGDFGMLVINKISS